MEFQAHLEVTMKQLENRTNKRTNNERKNWMWRLQMYLQTVASGNTFKARRTAIQKE